VNYFYLFLRVLNAAYCNYRMSADHLSSFYSVPKTGVFQASSLLPTLMMARGYPGQGVEMDSETNLGS